jgi:hypothetical protein
MNRAFLVLASVLVSFSGSAKERGETHEVGRWTYGCMEDHYDAYGDLLNKANCWMMICEQGKSCLPILHVTKEEVGLPLMNPLILADSDWPDFLETSWG